MSFLDVLFDRQNRKHMGKLEKIAQQVEDLSDRYAAMDNDELKACTQTMREQYQQGKTLDDLLPDAFACVREASTRVLGMRHFHVQILGGIVLHQGRIAEMRTGEGKTLVATLPAYLNALSGNAMHVVTVNDYLARRDAEWMGKIYRFLGMSVGVVVHDMSPEEKKAAYACDIVYGTNNEFGFDYLRDNMVVHKEEKMQRDLTFAIIDEVDSILIDEARTPLIISGRGKDSSEMYIKANRFAKGLESEDYEIDEKEKTIRLSEEGVAKTEKYFGIENLGDIENTEINHYVNNALRANFMMRRDKDYMVNDGEIIIIDEFTGRMMIGRRYSEGLHQAIEAKEGVRIQGESKTFATITFQNYFRLYKKLSGMTGTAKTEEEEFKGIYNLDVIVLPTNIPTQRIDEQDQLYSTEKGKIKAVIEDIERCREKGQPVLVGTVTVEKSEQLSEMLNRKKIAHNVLNAKNHAKEAEIIAQAGRFKAVTIATNMAGRGTDIMLGGNAEYMAKRRMAKEEYPPEIIEAATALTPSDNEAIMQAKAVYQKYYEEYKKEVEEEKAKVIEAGGLRIIGTERHESRRIDNQLRGRSGRQGDKGSTVFYISMEDDLLRVFGGDKMKSIVNMMNIDENTPISHSMLSKQVEYAQEKLESRNFNIRKHVLAYDDVMNKQREIIYNERNKVLEGIDIHEQIIKMTRAVSEILVSSVCDFEKSLDDWNFKDINRSLCDVLFPEGTELIDREKAEMYTAQELTAQVADHAIELYEKKIADAKEQGIDYSEIERVIMLRNVDTKWIDHIDAMHILRQGIGLRAYGQKNPVISYQNEGFEMFDTMVDSIQHDTVAMLMKGVVQRNMERQRAVSDKDLTTNEEPSGPVVKGRQAGRNDPCPCGSGKKYKNCCLNKK